MSNILLWVNDLLKKVFGLGLIFCRISFVKVFIADFAQPVKNSPKGPRLNGRGLKQHCLLVKTVFLLNYSLFTLRGYFLSANQFQIFKPSDADGANCQTDDQIDSVWRDKMKK
jgi:hypothetical protein